MSNLSCLYEFKATNKKMCSITMEKCTSSKCSNYVNLEDVRDFLRDEDSRDALLKTIEKAKAIKNCTVDCSTCKYCHNLGETMAVDDNTKFELVCTSKERFSSMVQKQGLVYAMSSMGLFSDSLRGYASKCLYYTNDIDNKQIQTIEEDPEEPIIKPVVCKKEPTQKITLRTKDDPIPTKPVVKNKNIPSVDTSFNTKSTHEQGKPIGVNARGAALILKKNVK